MANKKSGISDNEVKNASGGRTKYFEDIKKWAVIDNDDPDDYNYLTLKDNQQVANEADKWYHYGKSRGEKKAKKESYEQGYLQGRLDSGNHDIDV